MAAKIFSNSDKRCKYQKYQSSIFIVRSLQSPLLKTRLDSAISLSEVQVPSRVTLTQFTP